MLNIRLSCPPKSSFLGSQSRFGQTFPDKAHLQDGYILDTGTQPGIRQAHLESRDRDVDSEFPVLSHPPCTHYALWVQGQHICKHQQPSQAGPTRQASCAQKGEMHLGGHSQSWPAQSGLECLMSNLGYGSSMWEERPWLHLVGPAIYAQGALSSLFC